MKKNQIKKIKDLKEKELISRLEKARKEALKLKMQVKTGKQKDLHIHTKKRKEIAVILTQLRKRELEKEIIKTKENTGGKK